jgi:hypothetical protein
MINRIALVGIISFFALPVLAHASGCAGQPDGTVCDDGNVCTAGDVCNAGWCSGSPVLDGVPCDDGNVCTTADSCQWGWCRGSYLPDGTTCDDANPCTSAERCQQGACVGSVALVQPTGSPITATGPASVGDFNLDGKSDLVVLRAGVPSTFLVLLGDGLGGFTQASTIPSGSDSYPPLVVVADFNLDSRPDIATVQPYVAQGAVRVFFGNGAGGFVPSSSSIAVGSSMTALVTGDFNNDRKPDVVCASQSGRTVKVLLGDGVGSFVARSPVAAGPYPNGLVTGDFNRDGNLDIAVASPTTDGGVTILLGDGLGGLAPGPGSPYAVEFPKSMAVGDFDQDGNQDIAAANHGFGSGAVTILRGDGQGRFPLKYAQSIYGTPESVAAEDIDLDGQLDLVVGYEIGAVGVFVGTGLGYFRQAFGGSLIYMPGDDTKVALGDFDRDGRPDFVTTTSWATEVRIFLNRSEGVPCPASDACTVGVCERTTGACNAVPKSSGSVCDDRDLCTVNDTCIQGACTGGVVTCVALDACHLPGTCDPTTACSDVFAPEGADCDDDDACTQVDVCEAGLCVGGSPVTCTDPDQCTMGVCDSTNGLCTIVPRPEGTTCDDGAGCTAGDSCHVGSCVPAISFLQPSGSPVPVGLRPGPVAVADLNADTHKDLAVVNVYGDSITLLMGDGTGGFAPMDGSPIAAPRLPNSIATGDFNLDGFTDLAVTSYYSNPLGWLSVFLGVPGGFVQAPGSPSAVGNTPWSIVAGHFNQDPWIDLVLAISGLPNDEARWYFGDGTGRFTWSGSRFRAAHDIVWLRVADLDLDGKSDLVVANGSGSPNVAIVFGFTSAASARVDLSVAGGCWGAAVGDVNLDHAPDIVCLGLDTLTVFLGDGHRHFAQGPVLAPFDWEPFFVDAEILDLNLDGRPDLAVTKRSSPDALRIFLGDGTGYFAESASSPIQDLGEPGELEASDLDSDGIPDLAVASYDLNAVGIYLGSPSLSEDGTSCSDEDACTAMDRCSSGRCVPGPSLVCNDGNPCTSDSCNPLTGCLFSNNDNSCDDQNACTLNDYCGEGTCRPGRAVLPKVDCNDSNACTSDDCDIDIGCMHAPILCNDHDRNTIDSCDRRRGCVFTPRHGVPLSAPIDVQSELN